MEIVKDFENKLLKRRELEVELQTDGATLSRDKVKTQLVKELKVEDENLLVVEKIKSHFGSTIVSVFVTVYEDEKAMKVLTPQHIIKRNTAPEAEEKTEE